MSASARVLEARGTPLGEVEADVAELTDGCIQKEDGVSALQDGCHVSGRQGGSVGEISGYSSSVLGLSEKMDKSLVMEINQQSARPAHIVNYK